jgi:prepilin-type processing-associated H-X9-DG protein
MQLYAEDHNGRLPLAVNWCDIVKTRFREGRGRQTCPSLPKGQKGGYAFNSALSSHKTPIAGDNNLVLIFESDPGWNRHGQQECLLREPRRDHSDGFAFAFADGHVKWVGKEKTDSVRWNPTQSKQLTRRRTPGATK